MPDLKSAVKPAIVAVDDDPEVLRAVARDLRRRYADEYRIVRASSGSEALEAVSELVQRGDPIALLLSDQRMPDIDGVRFLTLAGDMAPRARRALLTAYADTDAAIAAINESRVDYFLLKPWDPPEAKLYPVVDELLATWKASYRPGYGGVKVIGDRWSRDSHRIREFLARNAVPYSFHDVESDAEARSLAGLDRDDAPPADSFPIVLLPRGERLYRPTTSELADRVGMRSTAASDFYNLAIVGGGPAGLACAVYGASEGLSTVLVEREATGGQAGTSSLIENYLGFPSGLSGAELARRATTQAKRFGVEILTPRAVEALEVDGQYRRLRFDDGSTVACHALMLAVGVDWRRLKADGAEDLTGRGIYYGAAMTEAVSCKGQHVVTVGGGNSAGQAALHFAEHADHVTMLIRGESLSSSMSQYLIDRIERHERIDVLCGYEVESCSGGERLDCITAKHRDGTVRRFDTSYLFVFIGAAPRTEWLGDQVARDERGFILTGPDLKDDQLAVWPLERTPFLLETNVPGVFAAGDVRHDSVKRVASAVGEGSVAIAFVHRHLANL